MGNGDMPPVKLEQVFFLPEAVSWDSHVSRCRPSMGTSRDQNAIARRCAWSGVIEDHHFGTHTTASSFGDLDQFFVLQAKYHCYAGEISTPGALTGLSVPRKLGLSNGHTREKDQKGHRALSRCSFARTVISYPYESRKTR